MAFGRRYVYYINFEELKSFTVLTFLVAYLTKYFVASKKRFFCSFENSRGEAITF